MRRYLTIFAVIALGAVLSGTTYINGVETFYELNATTLNVSSIIGPVSFGGETSSHSMTDDGAIIVNGLESNNISYFDAITYHTASNRHSDNISIDFGTGNDAYIFYNTSQTPDALSIGVSNDSRNFLIHEQPDFGTDFAHAQQTNPTLYIQSSDATDITQFISFTHDQTNAVIDTGKGKVTTPDAFQAADFYSGDGTQGATDSTSFWMCTAADCSSKCQVTIKDGLITSCS
jgi:hypothetical protein